MDFNQSPRIKICCISSTAEARLAIAHGANAVGLVSAMPSGPGVIDDTLIAAIAAQVPPGVDSFLLTCLQSVAAVAAQHRRLRTSTIQLCDRLTAGTHADLRAALPGIRLVQVIHVTGPESIAEATAIAPHVDAILLDSGNQNLAVKELGGTGRVHDWRLSRQIRDALLALPTPRPLYLAGGLNPENVAAAVAQVEPFGLDICSGVRRDNHLDPDRLAAFIAAARSAG
jgi:phosphoribosylanthranilate isomerase